jgi:hypothetical protein
VDPVAVNLPVSGFVPTTLEMTSSKRAAVMTPSTGGKLNDTKPPTVLGVLPAVSPMRIAVPSASVDTARLPLFTAPAVVTVAWP